MMPDNSDFDPAWLNSLGKRHVRLRQELEEVARKRDEFLIKYSSTNDDDAYAVSKDVITRNAAINQLNALIIFMEGNEHLLPELRKLALALPDLGSGRTVKWLHPVPSRKGQPPPPIKESFIHGYYAAVMDWLMKEGGKSRKEAAEFVVTHGGVRRQIEASGRARRPAHAWETVANWRDRATRPDAPLAERSAFDEMYRGIRSQDPGTGAGANVEDVAKKTLKFLKERYFLFKLGVK